MPVGPSTLEDPRKAGDITSREVVAAIDAYMQASAARPYHFPSGHILDIAAIADATPVLG